MNGPRQRKRYGTGAGFRHFYVVHPSVVPPPGSSGGWAHMALQARASTEKCPYT